MIISKTPYRISFFGGGSDYPSWYNKYYGSVLSTTIDKHIYLTCKFLPRFFEHKYRFVWSKIENVKTINEIKHPVVKNLLKHMNIHQGLEIHYTGDLPAFSGMGSSSAFTVGLINVLNTMLNKNISNYQIGKKAIYFEQKIIKEIVGSQDQMAVAMGGFNKIVFRPNNRISILPKKKTVNIRKLEKNLLLIYTGKKRVAHNIAKKYYKSLTSINKKYIDLMIECVLEGEKILDSNNGLDEFGKLLHTAWITKKKVSKVISNSKIDEIYEYMISQGALGGKLLGAGGGGFFLFYMKNHLQKRFLKKNKKILSIPFKFSDNGTEILYKD
jgi:D-glycero-alpha-D-manno-heptose-7-phosphate kinase